MKKTLALSALLALLPLIYFVGKYVDEYLKGK